MKRLILAMFLGSMLLWSTSVFAATPLGGLAVAVSPGGETLVSAGDNRVLYVLDAAKMEVTNRVWLGVGIVNLAFNKDGSRVVAEDTDGTLHLIDAKEWKVLKKAPKAERMSAAPQADLVAGVNTGATPNTIQILSMTDLSSKGQVTLPGKPKVVSMGLDAGGARLAVLLEAVADESEPKGATPPAGVKGLELETFKLKHDGKTSLLLIFNTADGKQVGEHKLWYSPSSTRWMAFFQGENVLVVNYSNVNAKIDGKGEVTLFQLDNSFNYGLGISADQTVLMSGGLSDGTYTKVEGLNMVKFQPDKLPGWPEYFKHFAVAKDGTAYGSTSSYRIIKIKPGGAFDKSYPVF
ncbi:MAG: hypothetical protein FJ128_05850 [Deltaproteobacteria bacterium]|nr:hypothetical protein [Deltaproteobacteria bacterium]